MQLNPVQSSTIAAIGYDLETKTLHIEFRSGHVYEYDDITPETHEALTAAPSIGAHFGRHIRPHHAGRKQ